MHLARRRVLVAAWLGVALAALLGSAPAAWLGVALAAQPAHATLAWSISAAPSPRLASTAVLSSVSCPSRRVCVAVGYDVDAAGTPVPLAERWNGRRWAIVSPPAPGGAANTFLFGVSCATPRSCTAVGSSTRHGKAAALTERWNGVRWALQSELEPTGLVGGKHPTAYLAAVACPSTTACTAVGYVGNRAGTVGMPLVARWTRGAGWGTQSAAPVPGAKAAFLSGVSCPAATDCTAVGFTATAGGSGPSSGATLAERWTAGQWRIERSPTPVGAGAVQLTGVSCPTRTSCTAVGYFDTAGIDVTLAERWDGARWRVGRPRYPHGARSARFAEVSCPSAKSCTGVGFFNDVDGLNIPLAERWTPRGWTVQPTPEIGSAAAAAEAELSGVSCQASVRCVAVGDVNPLSGTQSVLAESDP